MSAASRSNHLTAIVGRRFFLRSADRALVRAMDDAMEQVEAGLLREVANADPVADAAGRYLLQAGGKRVRPLLALLAANIGGGINDRVIRAAIALELTHVATLYHDDVMDEADVRRGVASVHRVWGNNVAILAGDILLARASQLAADLGERSVKMQAETFERLCLGQMHETLGPSADADPIEHYFSVLRDKTGSLIAVAGEIGLLLGGGAEEYFDAISIYGESVGLAFQLADDVLDLRTPAEQLGKNPGTDLREGVPTLPWLLLQKLAASDGDAAATAAKIERGMASDETAPAALAALAAHPVTEEALQEAYRWSQKAKSAISVLPESSAKSALLGLADYVVERQN